MAACIQPVPLHAPCVFREGFTCSVYLFATLRFMCISASPAPQVSPSYAPLCKYSVFRPLAIAARSCLCHTSIHSVIYQSLHASVVMVLWCSVGRDGALGVNATTALPIGIRQSQALGLSRSQLSIFYHICPYMSTSSDAI